MSDARRRLRILVVEDEAVTSMVIEGIIAQLGCEVVGPVSRVSEALKLTATADVDAAVLDVNLSGQPVYPVADRLDLHDIPFVFVTAYGREGIPPAHADRRVIKKPFRHPELASALAEELGLDTAA